MSCSATSSSPCSRIAAIRSIARPPITTPTCRHATPMSPSTCGCATWRKIDALVHLGTHGTLEWLPARRSRSPMPACPRAHARAAGDLPVHRQQPRRSRRRPKRRLGAVTIGHLTPPLRAAGAHGAAAELERLIDEYAAADGLDRRRARTLRGEILAARRSRRSAGRKRRRARRAGRGGTGAARRLSVRCQGSANPRRPACLRPCPLAPSGERCCCTHQGTPTTTLDASAPAERAALLAALDGRFVAAGPAGAPTRGRADVLPTGRNLFTIDPRAVPTRSAVVLAETAAADLLRRYVQDHGDWPRAPRRRPLGQRHAAHRRRGFCVGTRAARRAPDVGRRIGPCQRH